MDPILLLHWWTAENAPFSFVYPGWQKPSYQAVLLLHSGVVMQRAHPFDFPLPAVLHSTGLYPLTLHRAFGGSVPKGFVDDAWAREAEGKPVSSM